MNETEIKILEINKDEIEAKLKKLGAKKIFDGDIFAIFYQRPGEEFETSKTIFRLRKEGEDTVVTCKKFISKDKAKIMKEHEVKVSDFEEMKTIISMLNYEQKDTMEKHRTSYSLENAHFDIDTYSGKYGYIPTFMEIESDNLETIYKFANLLGYEEKDCLPWTYKELAANYQKQNK
jgi:adenylate cyclase class 2